MDGITLYAIRYEIGKHLPLRIQKVGQPGRNEICLSVWNPGFRGRLVLSVGPQPFFGMSAEKRGNLPGPPGFCVRLRRLLEGGTIEGIRQEGLDRVLYLDVIGRDDLSNRHQYTLVMDLAGRRANIGLFDPENGLMASLRAPDGTRFSPGAPYIPPPGQELNLLTCRKDEVREVLGSHATSAGLTSEGLRALVQGMGKELARGISTFGLGPAEALAPLESLREDLTSGVFKPAIYDKGKGEILFHVFPLPHLDSLGSFDDVLQGAYEYRTTCLERDALERLESRAQGLCRRIEKKLRARYEAQLLDLEETHDLTKYKIWGELIYASGKEHPPGQEDMEVLDYYQDPPSWIRVPLDPRYSAKDNAGIYYRKYNKMARAQKILSDSTARQESLLEELALARKSLLEARDATELEQTLGFLEDLGRRTVFKGQARKLKAEGPASSWKHGDSRHIPGIERVSASDGTTLYVGKSAAANDYLATRLKKKGDLWLHARGTKGAHVLARPPESGQVSEKALMEAARLAAARSQAASSGKVEIDVVPAPYVRKVRGSSPGFVTYANEKTIVVSLP